MNDLEINNSDIMIALDSIGFILGEYEPIVEITDEDDAGNVTKVTKVTVKMLREEYLKLFYRIEELENQLHQESVVEECQDN